MTQFKQTSEIIYNLNMVIVETILDCTLGVAQNAKPFPYFSHIHYRKKIKILVAYTINL